MHTITIPIIVRIRYDGTETQFIGHADELSLTYFGEGLDSLDSGDATGLFLRMLHDLGNDEDDPIRFEDGTSVYYERTMNLFQHEGDW